MSARGAAPPERPFADPVAPPDAVQAELADALAPRLQVAGRLGAGGMATVYLGRDPKLRRSVAIKVMSAAHAGDPAAHDLFLREAQAAATLDHPSVIKVYEVGELPRSRVPYFIMPRVEGESLAALIARGRRFTGAELRRLLGEIASGLAAAHAQGIVHRDVKPENVMVADATGRAIVVDFGISAARDVGDAAPTSTSTRGPRVSTGYRGTPAYSSPESASGQPVTEKSDVYSWGVMAFLLLTGRLPFREDSGLGMLAAHVNEPAPAVASLVDADPELAELVDSALRKDPGARPTATAIADRLAPGSELLLEWPPPGLDALLGGIRSILLYVAIGSALVAFPAFHAVQALPDIRYADPLAVVPSGVPLLMVALLGVLPLAVAGWLTFGLVRKGVAGVKRGYPVLTILEVIADRRGDTGALIGGTREYATLDGEVRADLRRRRLHAANALMLLATAPVTTFLLSLLITRGLELRPAALRVFAAAMMVEAAWMCAMLLGREWRLLRRARRARARVLTARTPDRSIARGWLQNLTRLAAGKHPRVGWLRRRPFAMAAVVLVALGTTWMILLVMTVVSFAGLKEVAPAIVMPRFARLQQRIAAARQYVEFAAPPDSSITLERAGQAFNNIQHYGADYAAGTSPSDRLRRPPTVRFDSVWYTDDVPRGEYPFSQQTQSYPMQAARLAAAGFTVEQRRFLRRAATLPTRSELAILARAPALDILAATMRLPLPDTIGYMDLRPPRYSSLRDAVRAELAQAALDIEAGRYLAADRRARGMIRVGTLLLDGTDLVSVSVGAVIVQEGRVMLTEALEASGTHGALPTDSMAVSDASLAAYEVGLNSSAGLRSAALIVGDTTAARGLRFAMAEVIMMSSCGDLRFLVFDDGGGRWAIEESKRSLVKHPGDEVLHQRLVSLLDARLSFDVGERRSPLERAYVGLARQADWFIGRRRFENCARLLLGGFSPIL